MPAFPSKYFQSTENINPCKPFENILVSKPRKNKPESPLVLTTDLTTSGYESTLSLVCLFTFTTQKMFAIVSETTDAVKPIEACRPRSPMVDSAAGRFCFRKLYVKNQGKCPTTEADAAAALPWKRTPTPFVCIFAASGRILPWTCMVTIDVSTGMRHTRKADARPVATHVLTPMFHDAVVGLPSRNSSVPVLAAVSPNLHSGACINAKGRPR
mmetsp:Transcript_39516/g.118614  ORF Transcript_39516/g.118614 Transcript_39516/m.118614 type:complete len:213 (+) Transcript_39516:154-792(+)